MLAAAHSNTRNICSLDNCQSDAKVRGFCRSHYNRALKRGDVIGASPVEHPTTCIAPDCNRSSEKRGYCQMHYRRMQRTGHLGRVRQETGSLVSFGAGYLSQRIDGEKKSHHVRVVEKSMGKALPDGVEIHHVNEIKSDNRPENLVVCPDRVYHQLLHARQRALDACGNANWRKCSCCGEYDDTSKMTGRASRGVSINTFYHKECAAKRVREGKARRKLLKA